MQRGLENKCRRQKEFSHHMMITTISYKNHNTITDDDQESQGGAIINIFTSDYWECIVCFFKKNIYIYIYIF